jgi:hypothetical protein
MAFGTCVESSIMHGMRFLFMLNSTSPGVVHTRYTMEVSFANI